MVKGIINYQEAVVDAGGCTNIYRCVLVIVPFYVQTQIIVNPLGINCSEDSFITLVQQSQDCFVDIIVNKDDAFVGTPYEVADKYVSIEYLPVEKNSFAWRQ